MSRYHALGLPTARTERIWLCCHGYGQLAEYFINNFEPIASEKDLIVAPEGLSRFYLNGFSGRVGASWMTKEDRLNEITDHCSQLDLVLQDVLTGLTHRPKLIAFGFSQGTATIMRWAMTTQLSIQRIVLWAGSVPPDLDPKLKAAQLGGSSIDLIYGENDEFYSTASIEEQLSRLKGYGMPVELHKFEGGHVISASALRELHSAII